jgi:precorrin-2/cobalt-factor-2 C20-methyltransferase
VSAGADGELLIGVGLGPGDPDLVTVRAVRVLAGADAVLVPATSGGGVGRAGATVRAHLPAERVGRIRPVRFEMGEQGKTARRTAAWEAAAEVALRAFADGARVVAFATIGDPNVYSTFSYLAQSVLVRRGDIRVETVPGITAMQDLAARAGIPLCEGTESLTLCPATGGEEALRAALSISDTVVTYKGGSRLAQVLGVLAEEGRLEGAVVGEDLGLPTQRLRSAGEVRAEVEAGESPGAGTGAGYLTTVIAPARRTGRGGRL